jgi:hypothetical protein
MIVFSRKIWNPDLLVPFMTITLLLAISAIRRYARWKVWVFAASLALLCQLHLSVWLAMLPLGALLLVFRPWHRLSDLSVGAVVFVAVYLTTLGPQIDDFIAALAGPSTSVPVARGFVRLAGRNLLELFRISSGTGFDFLLGSTGYAAFSESLIVQAAKIGFLRVLTRTPMCWSRRFLRSSSRCCWPVWRNGGTRSVGSSCGYPS